MIKKELGVISRSYTAHYNIFYISSKFPIDKFTKIYGSNDGSHFIILCFFSIIIAKQIKNIMHGSFSNI